MEEETKKRLTSRDVWIRALYMVLFAIAYSIAELIITLLVIFQFLTILFTSHANEPVLRFSNNLSTFVYQILQFVTFNTETQPFPFSSWPDEDLEDNRWLEKEASAPVGGGTVGEPEPSAASELDAAIDDEAETDSPPEPDKE